MSFPHYCVFFSPPKYYQYFLPGVEGYRRPHLLSWIACIQARLSRSALGLEEQLNYGIEIDEEINIYMLANGIFFLPVICPSCCPHAKNSLLGS